MCRRRHQFAAKNIPRCLRGGCGRRAGTGGDRPLWGRVHSSAGIEHVVLVEAPVVIVGLHTLACCPPIGARGAWRPVPGRFGMVMAQPQFSVLRVRWWRGGASTKLSCSRRGSRPEGPVRGRRGDDWAGRRRSFVLLLVERSTGPTERIVGAEMRYEALADWLCDFYYDFNLRDIDSVISRLSPDVDWAECTGRKPGHRSRYGPTLLGGAVLPD